MAKFGLRLNEAKTKLCRSGRFAERDRRERGEVRATFTFSPHLVRALIRKGEIPALRIGRSYRIPRTATDDYLARVLSPRSRSSPKPRAREVDELTRFLFPVGRMQ